MYFTRFGYFVIISIILVAVLAVAVVISPFGLGEDDGDGGGTVQVQPTATASAEPTSSAGLPSLTFTQVVNFAEFGAVVSIEEGPDGIVVNLRPDFEVSGLGTDSHAFTTTLPAGQPNVTAALEAEGLEVNGDAGVPVIQQ